MATREYEFREVRRLLGDPIEQKPTPDLIISALIREEQFMYNKLNGTGRSWTEDSVAITTVANQGSYTLSPGEDNGSCSVSIGSPFGKAIYVYRDLGNNVLLPVPFTDQNSELMNQSYDGFDVPIGTSLQTTYPYLGSDKIAFYRTTAGLKKARIYPIPEQSGMIYTIIYATGEIDWSTFQWNDSPILPEWSSLRCLAVALFLLTEAEWDGYDRKDTMERRGQLEKSLTAQMSRQDIEYQDYIRNPQHEPAIDTIDGWYEHGSAGRTRSTGTSPVVPAPVPPPTPSPTPVLIPAVYFFYNDASPELIYTPTDEQVISSVTLVILTAFNGTGAKVSIGTDSSHELLLAEADSDVSVASIYESQPMVIISDSIKVFITPGSGATTGKGMILMEYSPV